MKRFFVGILFVALIISITANVLLYARYSSNRPILRMNGATITRKEYRDALDTQYGKPVLRRLVTSRLVYEEAKKVGVLATPEETTARIEKIRQTNSAAVENAFGDPAALFRLQQDAASDIALERLRMRGVKVSDAEIEDYYHRNSDHFVRPMQVDTTAILASNPSDSATAVELLKQDIKPYVIARQPRLKVVGVGGFQLDLSHLTPSTGTAAAKDNGKYAAG